MAPISHKRHAITPADYQPSPKRSQSSPNFDTSMNLIRRTATGVAIPLQQAISYPIEDDDFVDAHEAQDDLADGGADGTESAEEGEEHGKTLSRRKNEQLDNADDEDDDDDDESDGDLFHKTFGKPAHQTSRDEDEEDDCDSDDTHGSETKRSAKGKGKQRTAHYTIVKAEHTDGCSGSPGALTPPRAQRDVKTEISKSPSSYAKDDGNKRRPTAPAPPNGPKEINPEKDMTWPLRTHKRLHDKAVQLIPRLELAPQRYWIGVLNIDKKPQHAKEEKHFTWMKGNRVITVETIWHSYQTARMTDGFVLLLGGVDRVDFKTKCEELDYFNDKKIIFQAVYETDPIAKGRELSEGCIPPPPPDPTNVIEILD